MRSRAARATAPTNDARRRNGRAFRVPIASIRVSPYWCAFSSARVTGDTRGDATTAENDIVFTANVPSDRARVYLPEISLVTAIFKDALRCVRRVNGSVTHRDSSEAAEWIASERSDWPFAFMNVCDVLGVDAQVVRARLGTVDVHEFISRSAKLAARVPGRPDVLPSSSKKRRGASLRAAS